jgi:hypothetical protein
VLQRAMAPCSVVQLRAEQHNVTEDNSAKLKPCNA